MRELLGQDRVLRAESEEEEIVIPLSSVDHWIHNKLNHVLVVWTVNGTEYRFNGDYMAVSKKLLEEYFGSVK